MGKLSDTVSGIDGLMWKAKKKNSSSTAESFVTGVGGKVECLIPQGGDFPLKSRTESVAYEDCEAEQLWLFE